MFTDGVNKIILAINQKSYSCTTFNIFIKKVNKHIIYKFVIG